ncbi:MAG TPA: tetratricopeptide repeat protein [Armatimonadetes bacterium]|nr:tetratricopeptide repeat protein [Armatimonadota bacterium]
MFSCRDIHTRCPCYSVIFVVTLIANSMQALGVRDAKAKAKANAPVTAPQVLILLLEPRAAPVDDDAQEALVRNFKEAIKTQLKGEVISFTPILPSIQRAMQEHRLTRRQVASPYEPSNFKHILRVLGASIGLWMRVAEVDEKAKRVDDRITQVEVHIVPSRGEGSSELIDIEQLRAEAQSALDDGKRAKKRMRSKKRRKRSSATHVQLFVTALIKRIQQAVATSPSGDDAGEETTDSSNLADALARARALAKQRKWEDAATIYRKLIRQNPDNTMLYIELGQLYENARRLTDAVLEYERATRVDPKCVEAWRRLAMLQYKRQRAIEALRAALTLIALAPDDSQHYFIAARAARLRAVQLSRVYAGWDVMELQRRAQEYYRKALELNPDDTNIVAEAVEYLIELHKRDEALKLLRQHISRSKSTPRLLALCLTLLTGMNRYDEAYGVLKQALGDPAKEQLLKSLPFEPVIKTLDSHWVQVFNETVRLLENFAEGLISREDAQEELDWLSDDAERTAAIARKLTPPVAHRRSHEHRLLSYELFSQAVSVTLLYIESGDSLHLRRAYLLYENARAEWRTAQRLKPKRRR